VDRRLTYRVIGRPQPRFDAVDKARGATRYAADWQMPGLLAGAILRSVHASAGIRVDVSRARALPGVAAVLTADDIPHN